MSTAQNSLIVLHADQEHTGIRFAVFAGLFVALLIGYRLVSLALRALAPPALLDYAFVLSCAGAIPIALLVIWGLEILLKRVWHSGLSIVLDESGLYVHDRRGGAEPALDALPAMTWDKHLGQVRWYFKLSGYPRGGRERRIPPKWFCLAAELQQDEARLSAYAFLPPERAAEWTQKPKEAFHLINQAELYGRSSRLRFGPPERPNLPNELLQTKEARYWLAERRRWHHGIELTPEDFATLLRYADRAAAHETTNH